MTSVERGLLAKEYFLSGYNCSQAVALAFSDVLEIDKKAILKMSSAFGGGMGRLREVCGAVSGAFLVLGYVRGYDEADDYEGKKRLYSEIQELAAQFKLKYGSIVCKELLAGVPVKEGSFPERRSPEYYKKRPCPEQIAYAAEILHEFLEKNGEI
jgi:C_GCAxxG_C_C family probable redox protein